MATRRPLVSNSGILSEVPTNDMLGAEGIDFTPGTAPAYVRGRTFYDPIEEALSYYNERSGITVNLGQETVIRVKNTTGSTLLNGRAIYISGSDGTAGVPLVSNAQANSDSTSMVLAILTEDIANNAIGYATKSGRIHGLDTSAWTAGTQLYLSPTSAGVLTSTVPDYPNRRVQVAKVITSNSTTGVLEVIIGGSGYGSQIGVFQNQTAKQTPRLWIGVGTVAGGSGVAQVFPTDTNLAGGNALFTNIYGVFATGSSNQTTAVNTILASHKSTSADKKTVSVTCVDGLTAIVAANTLEYSPNGVLVNVLIIGD